MDYKNKLNIMENEGKTVEELSVIAQNKVIISLLEEVINRLPNETKQVEPKVEPKVVVAEPIVESKVVAIESKTEPIQPDTNSVVITMLEELKTKIDGLNNNSLPSSVLNIPTQPSLSELILKKYAGR